MREFPVSLVLLHYILFSIREVAEQTEEGGGPRRSKRGRAAGQQDVTPAEPPSAPTSPNPKKSRKQNKDVEVAIEDPPLEVPKSGLLIEVTYSHYGYF